MKKSLDDPELERRFLFFVEAHPELNEPLGLWMADKGMCEMMHPEEAALFEREFPEL
jgi:hypothetical protein